MNEFVDVTIGIIGPGTIGEYHAMALNELGATVLAVAGPHPDENAAFSQAHSVERVYRDACELLADDRIAAVVVSSPSSLHAAQTLAAIDAGKPVLCEIPVGMSLSEAKRVRDASSRAGVAVMVGHTLRFVDSFRRMTDLVLAHEMEFTQIVARSLIRRHSNVGWTGRQREWTDSLLWHHGGHVVDMAMCLLGSSEVDVAGWCGPGWVGNGEVMDVSAVLRSEDRRLASVALSYHSRLATDDWILIGEELTYELRDGALLSEGELLVPAEPANQWTQPGQRAQAAAFLAAVVTGSEPASSIEAVYPAMTVLQRIQQAR